MITNFEHITKELHSTDLMHVDYLISILSATTQEKPLKAPELVIRVNSYAFVYGLHMIDGARLRKMINYIRANSLIPVIATKSGYFVSYDEQILSSQIKSLTERSNSIMDCVYGLNKILKNEA